MNTFRPIHPGKQAIRNAKYAVKALIERAEITLIEKYGYDFSDTELFPNGFIDMLSHADAYADWVAHVKETEAFEEIDLELLAAIRFIVDYGYMPIEKKV